MSLTGSKRKREPPLESEPKKHAITAGETKPVVQGTLNPKPTSVEEATEAPFSSSKSPTDHECTFPKDPRIILSPHQIGEMDELQNTNSIFVNRTSELSALFQVNAKCNARSQRKATQVQSYAIPVAAMTYGAGKTSLGENYLLEMRKWAKGDNLDEDQRAALNRIKGQDHHEQLQALCADDTVSVVINSATSLPQTLWKIYNQLSARTPSWTRAQPDTPGLIASLEDLISFIRQTKAIFIMVDEIGTMRDKTDVNELRTFLVDVHVANARSQDPRQAKPLHVYLCGRVDRERAISMATSLQSMSPYNWHSLVLKPLQAKHVRQIRERLDLSFSTDDRVNEAAEAHIVEQTAGVPRQIWRVLTAAKMLDLKFHSTDHAKTRLEELCRVLARHVSLQSDLVNLKAFGLINEFTEMHLMSLTDTHMEYHICSRYLPLTLKRVSVKDDKTLYQVQTAPIFTIGLSDERLQMFKKINEQWTTHWLPVTHQANEQELLVMQTIYRRMIGHGLAKQLATNRKVPLLTLKKLLPFLKNDDRIPDQELPDVHLTQHASELLKFKRNSEAGKKFEALMRAREGVDKRLGQVFLTKNGSSAADVVIDFPLVNTEEPGIRVVEVQIQARTGQGSAISPRFLRDDCRTKCILSPNPNEFTLHILSAQETIGPSQHKTGMEGIMVLQPGERVTFRGGNAGASEVEVTVPERMYLVALSPHMNQQWLSSTLDPRWLIDDTIL